MPNQIKPSGHGLARILRCNDRRGLGIAFLAPFNNTRYFLPWRPIPVAPRSVQGLFSPKGARLMLWEAALFGPFTLAAIVCDKTTWRRVCAAVCVLAGFTFWSWRFVVREE